MSDDPTPSAYRVILSAITAMTLVGALVGGVMLVTRARDRSGVQAAELVAAPDRRAVVLQRFDATGDQPFTLPVAADLGIDPVLLPDGGRRAVSLSRPGSAADLAVANRLLRDLAMRDARGARLDVEAIGRSVQVALADVAVVSGLVDGDADRLDDDGRFTVTAFDGSSVCVSLGQRRVLAAVLGLSRDPLDGAPVSGITWSADGPCDDPSSARPGAGSRSGTIAGTFGGVNGVAVCDAGALLAHLEATPLVARAWALAQSIEVSFLPDLVSSLTPVILLQDTLVTDHGFDDGRVLVRQAVLQRGTAVFVDRTGMPRVRCQSGSPLRAAQGPIGRSTSLVGDPWRGFSPGFVVEVTPAASAVSEFVVLDIASGAPLTLRSGQEGGGLPTPPLVGALEE